MGIIKNFDELARTRERKIVLEIIEAGLLAIQPDHVINREVKIEGSTLKILSESFNLNHYHNIYLVGLGKGSAGISKIIEKILGDRLTEGYVIDNVHEEKFSKIHFTPGTHPLPSEGNYKFTKTVLEKLSGLTERDLVLVVICGGGSAMFVAPNKNVTLDQKIDVNRALLKCGATIHEMNMVRKHLSAVKGGGLAKHLYPATVASLIFSDVPGNDLNVIASGPTVKDPTTVEDAKNVLKKYKIATKLSLKASSFIETPKDEKYFKNVSNILMISNRTALKAMEEKGRELGFNAFIYSDKFQGEAKYAARELTHITGPRQVLLAGGETTVKVHGNGRGGRNQEVVLGELPHLDGRTVVASVGSDGWDNTPFAGAIGDLETVKSAQRFQIDPNSYLERDASYSFFQKVKDGIVTDHLPSNVSDLFVVLKN